MGSSTHATCVEEDGDADGVPLALPAGKLLNLFGVCTILFDPDQGKQATQVLCVDVLKCRCVDVDGRVW